MAFGRGRPKKGTVSKDEIQNLGLKAIQDYFSIDLNTLSPDIMKALYQKANLGMRFEKEMNISKRNVEQSYIRIFKMLAKDKKELRKFVKKSLPQYSP